MKNNEGKIGQTEPDDQELNDSNANCGPVTREVKSYGDGVQPSGSALGETAWIGVPSLLFVSCVALGKFLTLCEPCLPCFVV